MTPEQLEDALRYQKETGQKIGDCLIHLGHARLEDVTRALARQAGLLFVDVRRGDDPARGARRSCRGRRAHEQRAPGEGSTAGTVILAVTDPLAVFNIEHLRFLLNLDFKCVLTAEPWMVEAFKRYFNVDKKDAKTVGDAPRKAQGVAKADDDAPIIRLVQQIFEDALRQRASDIHVEPMADRVRVALPRRRRAARRIADYPKHLQAADHLARSRSWRGWTSPRSASRRTAAST